MKKKYRVTPRGKIVFSLMGLLLIFGLYLLLASLVPSEPSNDGEVAIDKKSLETEVDLPQDIATIPEETTIQEDTEDTKVENCTTSNLVIDEETQKLSLLEAAGFTVYYEPNAYYVPASDLPLLVEFASVALKYPDEEIVIEGNVNRSIGPSSLWDTENVDQLGYARALVIKNDLIKRGVSEERIVIYNNKDEKPLNVDLSEESVALNRRADVFFSQFIYKEIDNK